LIRKPISAGMPLAFISAASRRLILRISASAVLRRGAMRASMRADSSGST
jgi:hypothetical protein